MKNRMDSNITPYNEMLEIYYMSSASVVFPFQWKTINLFIWQLPSLEWKYFFNELLPWNITQKLHSRARTIAFTIQQTMVLCYDCFWLSFISRHMTMTLKNCGGHIYFRRKAKHLSQLWHREQTTNTTFWFQHWHSFILDPLPVAQCPVPRNAHSNAG